MNRMNKLVSLAACGLVCSSVAAQNYMTTPPVGLDQDAASSCFIFGWSSKMQIRFLDDTHTTGSSMAIQRISFRADYQDHNAVGRTWDRLTLDVAKADYSTASMKTSYVKMLSTPTRVFDRKWSFPTLSGKPATNPASWGGPQGSLAFTFSQPWMYDGQGAIFTDYTFSGGVLANSANWSAQFPNGFEYYLDTPSYQQWTGTSIVGKTQSVPASPPACVDSFFSRSSLRQVAATAGVTGNAKTRPLQVALSIKTERTSPNDPVLYAIGGVGSVAGFDIGAGCNRLHLDPSQPFLVLPQAAPNNRSGSASFSITADWQAWMKEFWVQAAWQDSSTSALKLTHATRVTEFSPASLPRMLTSYTTPSKNGGLYLSQWFTGTKALPATRYTY